MANTREIRTRIKSVKNTAQITRAMQLVAASKMKRAQEAAIQGRPFTFNLALMMARVEEKLPENFQHPFTEKREIKRRGILVLGTDRGLCGSLNSSLFREVIKLPAETRFFSVGRKVRQFLARTKRELVADFTVSDQATVREVRLLIDTVRKAYLEGEIDTVEVLFPRFINTLTQVTQTIKVLPISNLSAEISSILPPNFEGREVVDERDQKFEPDLSTLMDRLLSLFFFRQLYQYVLASKASEQSARMVAMKAATDNANSLVDSLTLEYNKARQAAITQEILEISAATFFNN
ncbi:MAG: ATP synthase F1 subunit gamma [Puniceicoccaceae bacterium]